MADFQRASHTELLAVNRLVQTDILKMPFDIPEFCERLRFFTIHRIPKMDWLVKKSLSKKSLSKTI
jgi:hypothetical protein